MRKLQQHVLGLPVIDVSSGKMVGTVVDLYFDAEGLFRGIVVEKEGIFSKKMFINSENVGNIGENAIMIDSFSNMEELAGKDQFISFQTGENFLKGKLMLTANGQELGIVEDVYFNENLEKIIGYEISEGFFDDITEGRKLIPYTKNMVLGDVIILPQNESDLPF